MSPKKQKSFGYATGCGFHENLVYDALRAGGTINRGFYGLKSPHVVIVF